MMKKRVGGIISSLVLLVVSGCATIPTGPSVRVLPAPGKTFEQFQADDAVCRQWANQQIGISPQETVNQNAATGAVVGTAIGAGAGALIGAATGHPGAGAAIGAGSGLLLGTASGANAGNVYGWEAQRRYDNTYVQCMYTKGNQVPGTMRYYRTRRAAPPPPPDLNAEPPDYDYVPDNAPPPSQ
jgi:hypothetical protein